MRYLFVAIVSLVFVLNVLGADHPKIETFQQFKQCYNKHYEDENAEELARKSFLESLNWVRANRHKYDYDIGITSLADQAALPADIMKVVTGDVQPNHNVDIKDHTIIDFDKLPKSYDWRQHIDMSPLISQGKCGSCWAFVAAVTMEAYLSIHKNITVELSKQELIDCTVTVVKENHKCNGGHTFQGWMYGHQKGVHLEHDYPLVNHNNDSHFYECDTHRTGQKYFVGNYYDMIHRSSDNSIKAAVLVYGPISVRVYAHLNEFKFYRGGIMKHVSPNPTQHTHVLVILGWGHDPVQNVDYWIARNSWGTHWGEQGFARIQMGINSLGINDYPSFLA